jgi:hypothetical protein
LAYPPPTQPRTEGLGDVNGRDFRGEMKSQEYSASERAGEQANELMTNSRSNARSYHELGCNLLRYDK